MIMRQSAEQIISIYGLQNIDSQKLTLEWRNRTKFLYETAVQVAWFLPQQ